MRIEIWICDDPGYISESSRSVQKILKLYHHEFKVRIFTRPDIMVTELKTQAAPSIVVLNLLFVSEYIMELQVYTESSRIVFLPDRQRPRENSKRGMANRELKQIQQRFETILLDIVNKAAEDEKNFLWLSSGSETRKLKISQISYFEVYQRIVTVYYDNKSFGFYSSISSLEKQMMQHKFIRIHKAYLVNLKYVESVKDQKLILSGGVVLPIGRAYYKQVIKQMKEMQYPFRI